MTPCDDSSPPYVWIVVLNYNGRDHLGYCLPSIERTEYSNMKILVIDNASTDGSAEMVESLSSRAELMINAHNMGWSGGNNVGIKAALSGGADYVVLANNDVRVDPRWLWASVEIAEADPRIGIVGFRIFEPAPGATNRDGGFEDARLRWERSEVVRPEYVGGMAMLVRAEVFPAIGLIDEGFFAYGEENDLQIRARKAGYDIVATNVPVWHHGQGTFGRIPRRAAVLQTRNTIRLLLKHGKPRHLLRGALRHAARRLLPWRRSSPLTAVERRLTSGSAGEAVLILAEAVAWNVRHLPSTLAARVRDERRAARAARRWGPTC